MRLQMRHIVCSSPTRRNEILNILIFSLHTRNACRIRDSGPSAYPAPCGIQREAEKKCSYLIV